MRVSWIFPVSPLIKLILFLRGEAVGIIYQSILDTMVCRGRLGRNVIFA